uniref:Uncharacterized protein n=1 Tax=Magallana gigas TaxID=29159 RepID=A0A8W8P2M6_MAGGI
MVSLFGHSVYHFDVLTVWFCLLAVSQAAYVNIALYKPADHQYQYQPGDDKYDRIKTCLTSFKKNPEMMQKEA